MNFADVTEHIFLPLLTQETAVMTSAFAYGLKTGVSVPWLVGMNTLAVVVDLAVFFLPTYLLSGRIHGALSRRMGRHYERGARIVERLGAFRTATALAFVMPSVAAMITIGLLRLQFSRALGGLFLGSVAYVIIPLLVAIPLAATVPGYLLPLLRWTAPAIALTLIVLSLARAGWKGLRAAHDESAMS
jgi:hypothetical protein